MKSAIRLILATTAILGVSQASAQDKFAFYAEVEGWNIFKDNEKLSCFIEQSDELGYVVQMGLTDQRDIGYVGVFTNRDVDIKRDDKKEIGIILGDNVYLGQSTGMRGNITEGYVGGYVITDDPQFVEDIKQQREMVVFPETNYSFSINLHGTKKAIEAAVKCNSEF